jgi:hypothetical protein
MPIDIQTGKMKVRSNGEYVNLDVIQTSMTNTAIIESTKNEND